MYCPENILPNTHNLYIVRHDCGDKQPRFMRWRDRFNPLRVEIVIRIGSYPNMRRIKINRDAVANRWLSNLTWRLWREWRWRQRQRKGDRS